MLSAAIAIVMTGTLLAPVVQAQTYRSGHYGYADQPYRDYGGDWDRRGEVSDGGESGRSVGGSVGMAAGFVGGAAIAAAVLKASVFASMGPLVPLLIGSAITLAGGFAGAKLLSHGGQALTQAIGKQNLWMMVGAMAGTIAAIALIPALGPFAGAGGLVVKGLVGGLVGGIVGRLFANQLETLATPRFMMAGVGAIVGGLAGNIPGAVAGAAGGYAMGAIFDDHFFSKEGDRVGNYFPSLDGISDKLRDAVDRIRDWGSGSTDRVTDYWDDNWDNGNGRGGGSYYRDPYYRAGYAYADGPEAPQYGLGRQSYGYSVAGDSTEAAADYGDAVSDAQAILSDPSSSPAQRAWALEQVRGAESSRNSRFGN